MEPLVVEFMSLFAGFEDAHGVYNPDQKAGNDGKVLGKRWSQKGKVTEVLWERHLHGKQGLGVVPIRNDSKCKFAAIDIDEYPLDLVSLNRNIRDNDLPLTVCRTKSGGAHLYLFLQDWTPAKI